LQQQLLLMVLQDAPTYVSHALSEGHNNQQQQQQCQVVVLS
jgi:hypothetical protein